MPRRGTKRKEDLREGEDSGGRRITRSAVQAAKKADPEDDHDPSPSTRPNSASGSSRGQKNQSAAEDSTYTDNQDTSPKRTGGYPTTPDGHYFLVRSRLWRCADPSLSTETRSDLQKRLMTARRNLTNRVTDPKIREDARAEVQSSKVALGERGEVWWNRNEEGEVADRKMVWNTGYKNWWEKLSDEDRKGQRRSK